MAKLLPESEVKQFSFDFSEEIRAQASSSGNNYEIALLDGIADRLGECKIINNPHFFYWKYKHERKDIELFGYDIDEFDNSLTLFESDFGEPYHTITQSQIEKMIDNSLNFIRFSLANEKSFGDVLENEAFDLFDEIKGLYKTQAGISKIKVIIASNGKRSARAKLALKPVGNIDVELNIWDSEWIASNCNSSVSMEDIVIDANDPDYSDLMEGGLPCLIVPQPEKCFECYQCVVPGTLLATIYRRYGSPLLEGNVRSFLTSKTAVNAEIQRTILNNPERFYIYNNGIAAIASSVDISVDNGQQKITRMERLQIVNGGQTTASLAYSAQKRGADLSNISVPMKLTVIKVDSAEKQNELDMLIQKISETSNSQNKVSSVDFFANHPFHIRMKSFSEVLSQVGMQYSTYWFYERARGEYNQSLLFKTRVQQDSFKKTHPKEKLVTKAEFAKYYNLMKKRPDQVSKGGDTNFKIVADEIKESWDKDQSKFNELFFKTVIGVGEIYRTIEPEITKKKMDWFQGSYRANVIAYSISAFFWLVQRDYKMDFDLERIWDKGLSDALLVDLLQVCRKVYQIITADDRPVENVTQYCKKKACWDNVQASLCDFELPQESIKPYLQNVEEAVIRRKEAKNEQKIEDEVAAFSIALSYPYKSHWTEFVAYLESNRTLFPALTSIDLSMLQRLGKLDSGKYANVSTKECVVALKWWNLATAFGWK